MPNKRKQAEQEVVEGKQDPAAELQEFSEKVIQTVKNVATSIVSCGHTNRQSYNIEGVLEDVACELPKGHTGDHSAKIKTLHKNPYQTKNPRAEYMWVEGAEYEVKEVDTYWSDAAGTLASRIAPDYEGLSREEWVQKRRAKALAESKG